MTVQTRTFAAIVISVLIMVAFQVYLSKRYPASEVQPPMTRTSKSHQPSIAHPRSYDVMDQTDQIAVSDVQQGMSYKNEFYHYEKKILNRFHFTIDAGESSAGFDKSSPFIGAVVSHKFPFANDGYFLRSGAGGVGSLVDQSLLKPLEEQVEAVHTVDSSITYKAKIGEIEVNKTFRFHRDTYRHQLAIVLRNSSGLEQSIAVRLVGASGLLNTDETNGRFSSVVVKRKGYQKVTRRLWVDLAKRGIQDTPQNHVEWAGLHNRYFAVLFRPLWEGGQFFLEMGDHNQAPVVGISETIVLPSGAEAIRSIDLYIGPMELAELERGSFHEVLDFGVFGWISRAILSVMFWIRAITKSYGLSIILMTVLINLVLYPLTAKSLLSMKRIQVLQPQVDALRERYKDDYAKLNKEMMELYRKHKVNPMGGCLPMLLQMPIFIALYQALSKSVELWGASFLSIHDLSRPDRLVPLPFDAPVIGSSLNILPVFMSGAMFVQQKVMSTSASTQQAQQMAVLFPIMFLFICYQMPSGLIIYWITHTMVTLALQWFVTKRMGIGRAA